MIEARTPLEQSETIKLGSGTKGIGNLTVEALNVARMVEALTAPMESHSNSNHSLRIDIPRTSPVILTCLSALPLTISRIGD